MLDTVERGGLCHGGATHESIWIPLTEEKSGAIKLPFQEELSLTVVLLADRSETHLFFIVFHTKIVQLNIKANPCKSCWDAKNSQVLFHRENTIFLQFC